MTTRHIYENLTDTHSLSIKAANEWIGVLFFVFIELVQPGWLVLFDGGIRSYRTLHPKH